jgi:hypothetical protein
MSIPMHVNGCDINRAPFHKHHSILGCGRQLICYVSRRAWRTWLAGGQMLMEYILRNHPTISSSLDDLLWLRQRTCGASPEVQAAHLARHEGPIVDCGSIGEKGFGVSQWYVFCCEEEETIQVYNTWLRNAAIYVREVWYFQRLTPNPDNTI